MELDDELGTEIVHAMIKMIIFFSIIAMSSSFAVASLEMYVYCYGPSVTNHNLIFITIVRI